MKYVHDTGKITAYPGVDHMPVSNIERMMIKNGR